MSCEEEGWRAEEEEDEPMRAWKRERTEAKRPRTPKPYLED